MNVRDQVVNKQITIASKNAILGKGTIKCSYSVYDGSTSALYRTTNMVV